MKPISPVLPHDKFGIKEYVYAKDQKQYRPLPAALVEYEGGERGIISRWQLTFGERLRILFFGDLWLSLLTFGHPPQPQLLYVKEPFRDLCPTPKAKDRE